jgi:hypothetical protein
VCLYVCERERGTERKQNDEEKGVEGAFKYRFDSYRKSSRM